jgi:peptidoglycan hydrolase CwlO-like protein
MKKSLLTLAITALIATGFTSCKEETKLDNLEDKLENRSDDLEDASDDIGDAAHDIEEALDNLKDALQEIDNPADREAVRERVNTIIDEMQVNTSM